MAFVTFLEPQELAVPYEQMISDGKPKSFGYTVENPHPGYGKDPNILNELGHTKYPMWVDGKLAHNEEEEMALRGATAVPANAWPSK